MMLSEAIPLYLESREADGYALRTLINNKKDLNRILRICGDMDVAKLSPIHLDRILAVESDRGMAPGSLNNIHACLAAFSRWCRERGHMSPNQNPVGSRRYRKDPPKQRDLIPLSDFPRLLDAAEQGEAGPRDRAFIAGGLYLMVRQSELCNIRVKDLNLETGEVDVLIKKTRDRDILPVSAELAIEMTKWLAYYASKCGPLDGDWYLFPAIKVVGYHEWELNPTAPISRSQDIVKRALNRIGWKDKWVGVHVLRRSSARARLDENEHLGYDAAMREIQSWLHHSTITTTERYLQMQPDRSKRNKRTSGKPMFPSLSEAKVADVHDLRGTAGG